MRAALADLRLTCLDVIHAEEHSFALAANVRAVAVTRLLKDVQPLK